MCKWFKSGLVFEYSFFQHNINAVYKALEIVNRFNHGKYIDNCIKINMPEVWIFDKDATGGRAGSKVLCEPYIENYQKYNSSTVRFFCKSTTSPF